MKCRFYVTVPSYVTTAEMEAGWKLFVTTTRPTDVTAHTRIFTFEVAIPIPDPPPAVEIPAGDVSEIVK